MLISKHVPIILDKLRENQPVLVGIIPLFAVTNFTLTEGYKTAEIAGSTLKQLVRPTTKTINIQALLVGRDRALRPALEALSLSNRTLAASVAPLNRFTGITVVTKNSVNVEMQITSLVFTQDNQMRNTLKVSMTLTHVPRSLLVEIIGEVLDMAVGTGTPFI
jgi:hypothetical protein